MDVCHNELWILHLTSHYSDSMLQNATVAIVLAMNWFKEWVIGDEQFLCLLVLKTRRRLHKQMTLMAWTGDKIPLRRQNNTDLNKKNIEC